MDGPRSFALQPAPSRLRGTAFIDRAPWVRWTLTVGLAGVFALGLFGPVGWTVVTVVALPLAALGVVARWLTTRPTRWELMPNQLRIGWRRLPLDGVQRVEVVETDSVEVEGQAFAIQLFDAAGAQTEVAFGASHSREDVEWLAAQVAERSGSAREVPADLDRLRR